MTQELLKEFVIEEIDDNIYFIVPTDKAYELLGLNEKIKLNRKNFPIDTMDAQYYRAAITHYIAKNYNIQALVRESCGNSHDANWKKEVIIIRKSEAWADKINMWKDEKADCYSGEPDIIEVAELTPEIIDKWAKTYDCSGNGEERNGRFILCTRKDCKVRVCFYFKNSYVTGTAADRERPWNTSINSPFYHEPPQNYRYSGYYVQGKSETWNK